MIYLRGHAYKSQEDHLREVMRALRSYGVHIGNRLETRFICDQVPKFLYAPGANTGT
jgi:hypothetical protein